MSVFRLMARESLFRGGKSVLSVCAVLVAVGSLVSALTLFKIHELRTQAILQQRGNDLKAKMDVMNDNVRKAMLKLGFNVVILPKDQNLADFYADDYAVKDMPEDYVNKLAGSKIVTVRHLLPALQTKVDWAEAKRKVILVGTRGEIKFADGDPERPMVQPVQRGKLMIGYELHNAMGLKAGDKVKLMDREFTVQVCHPSRGTKDDITVWINLSEAQEMLGKPGRINSIMALECKCAWADLAKVRSEIVKILPETQVIEKSSEALARAEARLKVEEDGLAAIAQEKAGRQSLKDMRERLAAIIVPVTMLVCVVWIAFMVFTEARERRMEIGVLRAIGVRTGQVLALFLTKAVVTGLVGGVLGVAAGFAGGLYLGSVLRESADITISMAQAMPDAGLLAGALLVAPVLSLLSSWIPAVLAAREDPAVILREG